MLDKSVDYKNIIMKMDCSRVQDIIPPILPDGYSFRYFIQGDEAHWARIEASVLEFDSSVIARNYFEKAYLPYSNELHRRCLFVLNQDSVPIATANAWFADSELGHQASLHWVAVCPECQGLGIGKEVVKQALINFQNVEPNHDVWLHTQTWSHVAVKLYHSLGFSIMKNGKLANMNSRDNIPKIYPNDFDEAIAILKKVMDDTFVERLVFTAV